MAEDAAVVEEGFSPAAQSPLVAVTFQRNVYRKEKYLEAEPKALGITQIGLSMFKMISCAVFLAKGLSVVSSDITFFISSLLMKDNPPLGWPQQLLYAFPPFTLLTFLLGRIQVVVAGSVAIAAETLHLPTLRACFGMQIVACGASIVNIVCTLVKMEQMPIYCWEYYYHNTTPNYEEICHQIEKIHSHFFAGGVLVQTALLAISVTLAVYCCKVVNCCAPAPKVPVITVQAPPAPQ